MSDGTVRLEVRAGVWHATLNRPEQGNACSPDLVQGLSNALANAEADGALAFVLQGAGRHFCTGFDLSHLERETDDTLLARFVRIELLLQRLARAPFLTVALAHGRTMGAGADLFAACGVRLAQSGTSFAFPGARGFGLVLGTRRLASRVGTDAALEWVESGRLVQADEAHARGLVSLIVDGPQALSEALSERGHDDIWVARALRTAVDTRCATDDAADLDLLVRSAARSGLRDRIAAYVQQVAARRVAATGRP